MPNPEQAPTGDSGALQTAQSIEDKLAAEFEGTPAPDEQAAPEPEKADADSADGEAPALEEVEYEGEKYQVPAKLKEAIIHKSDYTRKTQEVADARRQVELQSEAFKLAQAESAFTQTIDEPLRNLSILEARTKDLLSKWQELTTDQKQELLYLDKTRDQIKEHIAAKRAEFDQSQQKALSDLRAKCADAVRKAIPGWSDQTAKDITSHAMGDGYTQAELAAISDPRHVKTLWKALQYDRLQEKAKAAPTKPPAVVKPGPSNPMSQQTKDKLAFRKEMAKAQTPTQKARLIEERFAKQFGG